MIRLLTSEFIRHSEEEQEINNIVFEITFTNNMCGQYTRTTGIFPQNISTFCVNNISYY